MHGVIPHLPHTPVGVVLLAPRNTLSVLGRSRNVREKYIYMDVKDAGREDRDCNCIRGHCLMTGFCISGVNFSGSGEFLINNNNFFS
jgi:hypothetical protein